MAFSIIFNQINVNSLNTNANVAIGVNNLSGWDTHNKSNFAFGQTYGISATPANINNIVDNDVIDTPITDANFKPGFTIQSEVD